MNEIDEREPEGFANYRGDVRGSVTDLAPYGPGYDGELRWAVEVSYDEATNMSRVGFTRRPPNFAAAAAAR